MNKYQIAVDDYEGKMILKYEGSLYIPEDINNKDWVEYLAYVDAGGETDPLPTTAVTAEGVQSTFKRECTEEILKLYPETIQRSAALGVYPNEFILQMTEDISLYIEEENRCFDEAEAATTVEELEAIQPFWRSK